MGELGLISKFSNCYKVPNGWTQILEDRGGKEWNQEKSFWYDAYFKEFLHDILIDFGEGAIN